MVANLKMVLAVTLAIVAASEVRGQRRQRGGRTNNPFLTGSSDEVFAGLAPPAPGGTPLGLDVRTVVETNRGQGQNFDPFSNSNNVIDSRQQSSFATSPASTPRVSSRPPFNSNGGGSRPPFNSGGRPSFNDNNGAASPPGGIDFSQATRTEDGRLCVIKESEVETIAKDPILECVHKNEEKCHYTYVTQFVPTQEEVCEENFEKTCQITFKQQAVTEKVRKCYKPQRKVCNGQGPTECRTVYESSCSTRYIEKQPGQFVGDTSCEKLPVEICGAGCTTEEGPEECHDKEVDALLDVPEETCDLNPQKTCRFATRLAPRLKPKHECTIVPREICNLKFSSPRKSTKPLRSEWCLDESPVEKGETYLDAQASASQAVPVTTSYLPGYSKI